MEEDRISKELEDRIVRDTNFGMKKKQSYQKIDEIRGTRNMAYRYRIMKLPKDFGGKSVLDIGCNLGAVCIEAKRRGAGRTVGIDQARMIDTITEFARVRRCGVSFIGCDVNNGLEAMVQEIGAEKFDYVFALSIWKHVEKDRLWDIINFYCKTTCWFEGHNKQSRSLIERELSENLRFSEVEFLGYCTDRGCRANFVLRNKYE